MQKCPYCDFNSHQLKSELPEKEYIAHLLADLDQDLPLVSHKNEVRELKSIFIGGGTPSLLSVEAMQILLDGVKKRMPIATSAEITMEANPGTVEADKFTGFKHAGITRISIGIQSFQSQHLAILGRIHDAQQAHNAVNFASELQLRSFNTDLMHGLPSQSVENALSDLTQAIDHAPPHLSWYQLTIEPNTLFYSKPPTLPVDDVLWDIQTKGADLLAAHGYEQYEISAYAQKGHQCQHNINYWRYGDYLGIGCGAHGKITNLHENKQNPQQNLYEISRTVKVKHPKGYMDISRPYLHQSQHVENDDLGFEFFMNRFRLLERCPKADFVRYTGRQLESSEIAILDKLIAKGLLLNSQDHWQVSELGRRYLNTMLEEFV